VKKITGSAPPNYSTPISFTMATAFLARWQLLALMGLPLMVYTGCAPSWESRASDRSVVAMLQFIGSTNVALANPMVEPLLFESVSDFSEGVAMVNLGDRLGYIDHNGNLVINVADDNVGVATEYRENLALARVGDYYGYLGRDGDWAIEVQFRQAKPFSEGFAAVQRGSQYGFINPQGEWRGWSLNMIWPIALKTDGR
jgi:hypothetical protein